MLLITNERFCCTKEFDETNSFCDLIMVKSCREIVELVQIHQCPERKRNALVCRIASMHNYITIALKN